MTHLVKNCGIILLSSTIIHRISSVNLVIDDEKRSPLNIKKAKNLTYFPLIFVVQTLIMSNSIISLIFAKIAQK